MSSLGAIPLRTLSATISSALRPLLPICCSRSKSTTKKTEAAVNKARASQKAPLSSSRSSTPRRLRGSPETRGGACFVAAFSAALSSALTLVVCVAGVAPQGDDAGALRLHCGSGGPTNDVMKWIAQVPGIEDFGKRLWDYCTKAFFSSGECESGRFLPPRIPATSWPR